MDSLSGSNRGQAVVTPLWVGFAIALIVAVLVGAQVYAQMNEENIGPPTCESEYGENATWVNDSDDTLDCELPNGTVVEDVPINLTSASDDVVTST